jgi:cysteinyl-tRNA synthetase
MSKSLGNILTLKEISRDWHPEAIRLFLLSSHYRSPVDFSFDSLSEVKTALDRFYATLKAIQDVIGKKGEGLPCGVVKDTPQGEGGDVSVIEEYRQGIESFQVRFEEAMDDDFNTAQALGYFYDLQRHLNSLIDLSKGRPTEEILALLKKGVNHLTNMGSIFGLFQEKPETYLDEQRKEGLKRLKLSEEEILKFIDERNAARKEKDWKKADEIRNDLLSKGIVLEDTPSGTIWKIKQSTG